MLSFSTTSTRTNIKYRRAHSLPDQCVHTPTFSLVSFAPLLRNLTKISMLRAILEMYVQRVFLILEHVAYWWATMWSKKLVICFAVLLQNVGLRHRSVCNSQWQDQANQQKYTSNATAIANTVYMCSLMLLDYWNTGHSYTEKFTSKFCMHAPLCRDVKSSQWPHPHPRTCCGLGLMHLRPCSVYFPGVWIWRVSVEPGGSTSSG